MTALQVTWFLLIGALFTGYAVLDGFDLGVGFWYLFTKKDEERRTMLNAIGPVWDGNEVWLLSGGGALFAAFPPVYATVFSALYLPLMIVLFALILRAVSVEFRSSDPSPRWRKAWDCAFAFGSVVPAVLLGVAWGNILRGLPLDKEHNYVGVCLTPLNAYSLLIGLVGLAMLAAHGALYITVKTEGCLAQRASRWAQRAWGAYLILFLAAAVVTVDSQPQLLENYRSFPLLWLCPVLALAALVSSGLFNARGKPVEAFLCSALSVAGLMVTCGCALFPNLLPSLLGPEANLTVWNSSSSQLTLKAMLVLALLAVPTVLVYTVWVYRTFGGKVKQAELHY